MAFSERMLLFAGKYYTFERPSRGPTWDKHHFWVTLAAGGPKSFRQRVKRINLNCNLFFPPPTPHLNWEAWNHPKSGFKIGSTRWKNWVRTSSSKFKLSLELNETGVPEDDREELHAQNEGFFCKSQAWCVRCLF